MIIFLIAFVKYNNFYIEKTGIRILNEWIENLYFDTPGNLMKYFLILSDPNINLTQNKLIRFKEISNNF